MMKTRWLPDEVTDKARRLHRYASTCQGDAPKAEGSSAARFGRGLVGVVALLPHLIRITVIT